MIITTYTFLENLSNQYRFNSESNFVNVYNIKSNLAKENIGEMLVKYDTWGSGFSVGLPLYHYDENVFIPKRKSMEWECNILKSYKQHKVIGNQSYKSSDDSEVENISKDKEQYFTSSMLSAITHCINYSKNWMIERDYNNVFRNRLRESRSNTIKHPTDRFYNLHDDVSVDDISDMEFGMVVSIDIRTVHNFFNISHGGDNVLTFSNMTKVITPYNHVDSNGNTSVKYKTSINVLDSIDDIVDKDGNKLIDTLAIINSYFNDYIKTNLENYSNTYNLEIDTTNINLNLAEDNPEKLFIDIDKETAKRHDIFNSGIRRLGKRLTDFINVSICPVYKINHDCYDDIPCISVRWGPQLNIDYNCERTFLSTKPRFIVHYKNTMPYVRGHYLRSLKSYGDDWYSPNGYKAGVSLDMFCAMRYNLNNDINNEFITDDQRNELINLKSGFYDYAEYKTAKLKPYNNELIREVDYLEARDNIRVWKSWQCLEFGRTFGEFFITFDVLAALQ